MRVHWETSMAMYLYVMKVAKFFWNRQRTKMAIRTKKPGLPQVTTDKAAKIGNFNPDWTLGWSNTLTYKGFSLYFLIDTRMGGDVISLTQAGLDYAV